METDSWTRMNALFEQLLPITNLGESLLRLARGWKEITGADAVFVSVPLAAGDLLRGVYLEAEREPVSLSIEPFRPATWDADRVIAGLLTRLQIELAEGEAAVPIPFEAGEIRAGGVILLCRSGATADTSLAKQLSTLSCGVVRQAVWQEDEAARLRHAKLEALAEFAAGAGHEINNPLATIAGRAALLLRDEHDPERRRSLATIGGQAHRIRDMIGDLMLFARPPEPHVEPLNLVAAMDEVLERFQDQSAERGCQLESFARGHVPVLADKTQLAVALSCLVQNALDASVDGDKILLNSWTESTESGLMAVFEVGSRGAELTAADREHLFDPFYSGRPAGRGLGFGLSKVWRIVQQHGGQIDFTSDASTGMTFRVRWPAETGT